MTRPFLRKGAKLYGSFAGKPNDKPSYYILETTPRGYLCSFGRDPKNLRVVTSICWIIKSLVSENETEWLRALESGHDEN